MKDAVNKQAPVGPIGKAAATIIITATTPITNIMSFPSDLKHLGEGTGTFAGDPTLRNSLGVVRDAITVASVVMPVRAFVTRPYWRYISEFSLPTYDADMGIRDGTWLTRGDLWGPPFKSCAEAKEMLQMPNMPTEVIPVKVPWFKYYLKGREVGNDNNLKYGTGGGTEYRIGGFGDGK